MVESREPSLRSSWIGRVLDGRYRIERSLGGGGMGEVFLADDERMDRSVVVKIPHPRLLADPGFRERFEKEIRSLTRLDHPHVVKAHDVGVVDGIPYIVLQYLPGGNLKDRIRAAGGCLSPAQVLEWLPGVAAALDFIHGEGVVHRDVKPSNVLFDANGHVYLADFGIAKALSSEDTGLTQTGATPGSPDYMAPEIVAGGRLHISYDEYSLGVVVYEALAGCLPHRGPTPLSVLFQKQTVPPVPLAKLVPHISPSTSAAVMRALDREPGRRFHTCGAFARAFSESVLAAAHLPKCPPPWIAPPAAQHASSLGTPPVPSLAARPQLPDGRGFAPVVLGRARRNRIAALIACGVLVAGIVAFAATRGSSSPEIEQALAVRPPDLKAQPPRSDSPVPASAPSGPARLSSLAAGVAPETAAREDAPPIVVLEEPAEGATLSAPYVRVRGTFRGRPSDALKVNGKAVERAYGRFDVTLALESEGAQEVSLTVESNGAQRLVPPLVRHVNYAPSWRPILEDAESKGQSGDWNAAKTAWLRAKELGARAADASPALLDGLRAYDADPVLKVFDPADGATLTEATLHVRGELELGRSTDVVAVNGKQVRTGTGPFDISISLLPAGTPGAEPTPHLLEVTVTVSDRGVIRGAPIVHRVTYAPETWASAVTRYLVGWAQPEGAGGDRTTGYPKRIRRTKDSMVMALVPAGTFLMGALSGDALAEDNEKPRHRVTLTKPYYMDVNEVTAGQWRTFLASTGGRMREWMEGLPSLEPIREGHYESVLAYARWAGASLPTEAQWERAARAGHDDYPYPWGMTDDAARRRAAFKDNVLALSPVRSYEPNDFGLYDMAGNVGEWCSDLYDANYYMKSPTADPLGPELARTSAVPLHVVRGDPARSGDDGSLGIDPRTSKRGSHGSWDEKHGCVCALGFRLVRTLP